MAANWLLSAALLCFAGVFSAWRVNRELGGARIALRSLFHMLIALVFTGAAGATGAAAFDAACFGAMATVCAAVALVDARTFLIPDALVVSLIVIALIMPSAPPLYNQAIGATVLGGLFYLVRAAHKSWRGEDGLGLGDVKLAAVMGALLGTLPALIAVAGAALFTAAWISTSKAPTRTESGKPAAAFGVGLALATIATAAAQLRILT